MRSHAVIGWIAFSGSRRPKHLFHRASRSNLLRPGLKAFRKSRALAHPEVSVCKVHQSSDARPGARQYAAWALLGRRAPSTCLGVQFAERRSIEKVTTRL